MICDLCKGNSDVSIVRPDLLVVNDNNVERTRPLVTCFTCSQPEKQTSTFRMTLQHLATHDLVGSSRSAMTVAQRVQTIAANALYKGEVPK